MSKLTKKKTNNPILCYVVAVMVSILLIITLTNSIKNRWEYYDASTGVYTRSMEMKRDSLPAIEFEGLTYEGDTAKSGYVWVNGDRPDYVLYDCAFIYYYYFITETPVYTQITERKIRRR